MPRDRQAAKGGNIRGAASSCPPQKEEDRQRRPVTGPSRWRRRQLRRAAGMAPPLLGRFAPVPETCYFAPNFCLSLPDLCAAWARAGQARRRDRAHRQGPRVGELISISPRRSARSQNGAGGAAIRHPDRAYRSRRCRAHLK